MANAATVVQTTSGAYVPMLKDRNGKSIVYLNGKYYYATAVQRTQSQQSKPTVLNIPDTLNYTSMIQSMPNLNIELPELGTISIPKIDIDLPKIDLSFLNNIDLSPLKNIVSSISGAISGVLGEIGSKIPLVGSIVGLVSGFLSSGSRPMPPEATQTDAYGQGIKLYFDGLEGLIKDYVANGYMRRKLELLRSAQ